jgi:hypothetical protein
VQHARHRHLRSGGRPPHDQPHSGQADATIEELAVVAIAQGASYAADGHGCLVSLEEADEPLTPGVTLTTAGIGHRSRVHLYRCRTIHVTVSFN